MTRFLASPSLDTLLADLASFGFVFDNPNQWDIIQHGQDACIYLGHIPALYDEEGNIIKPASTDWCANVTACIGHTFATEIAEPETPYNKFAE